MPKLIMTIILCVVLLIGQIILLNITQPQDTSVAFLSAGSILLTSFIGGLMFSLFRAKR